MAEITPPSRVGGRRSAGPASAMLRLARSPPRRVRFGVAARRLADERFRRRSGRQGGGRSLWRSSGQL